MGGLVSALKALFASNKRLEIVLVGLENSGKSTFGNQLSLGPSSSAIEEPPTVGLQVKVMKRGNVTAKIWDLGGGAKYRSEWPRYTRGANVIVFVVDATDRDRLSLARKELHQLLEDRELNGMPLLVLANKIDLAGKVPIVEEKEMIRELNLDYITESPWLLIPVSAKVGTNVDKALNFLLEKAEKAGAGS